MIKFYRECYVMFKRQMSIMLQSPDALVSAIMIPSLLMFLFVNVFGGAMNVGDYSYVNYVTFGILMMAACQASAIASTASHQDLNSGVMERFRSMPISKLSFLIGHVLAGSVRNMIACVGMISVALVLGFRPTASVMEWVWLIGIVMLCMVLFSWLAMFISVIAKSTEAAAGYPALLALLPFLSSAFAPVETLPSWLQGFARVQPITPIVDTLRGIAFGGDVGSIWGVAVVWLVGLIVGIQFMTLLFFKRKLDV